MRLNDADQVSDIRSDLLPALETRFGEIYSRVEDNRLFFKFRSEENAICGLTAINAYLGWNDLPARVITPGPREIIIIFNFGGN